MNRPVALGAAAAVVTGAAIGRADHDYRAHGELTSRSAALAWAAYGTHLGAFVAALFDRRRLPLPPEPAQVVGGALALAGSLMYVDSLRRFGSFAQFAGRSNEHLVTDGVHRYSRNPQNVGHGLSLAGLALAARRPAALGVAAAFWPPFAVYARVEERHLRQTYGAGYERYRACTPRYLGRPG